VLSRRIVAAASRFVEYPTLLSALALGWWISMHGRLPLIALLLCLLSAPTSSLPQSHALPPPVGGITFEQVIRLSQSGLSDAVIIAQIKKRPQPFNLSPDELLQLKDAHVGNAVIEAMTASAPQGGAAVSAAEVAGPSSAYVNTQILFPGIRFSDTRETVQRALLNAGLDKLKCGMGSQNQISLAHSTEQCSVDNTKMQFTFEAGKLTAALYTLSAKECRNLQVVAWMTSHNDMAIAIRSSASPVGSYIGWSDPQCLSRKGRMCVNVGLNEYEQGCFLQMLAAESPDTSPSP